MSDHGMGFGTPFSEAGGASSSPTPTTTEAATKLLALLNSAQRIVDDAESTHSSMGSFDLDRPKGTGGSLALKALVALLPLVRDQLASTERQLSEARASAEEWKRLHDADERILEDIERTVESAEIESWDGDQNPILLADRVGILSDKRDGAEAKLSALTLSLSTLRKQIEALPRRQVLDLTSTGPKKNQRIERMSHVDAVELSAVLSLLDSTLTRQRGKTMSAQTPVDKSSPLWLAWVEYKKSEEYANSARWAIHPEHVEGSLWAAFVEGFNRRVPPQPAPPKAPKFKAGDRVRHNLFAADGTVLVDERAGERVVVHFDGYEASDNIWGANLTLLPAPQPAEPTGAKKEWRSMDSAPTNDPVYDVELRLADGRITVGHYAFDESGEDQPPFRGWFERTGTPAYQYFSGVQPVAWRPLASHPAEPERETTRLAQRGERQGDVRPDQDQPTDEANRAL